MAFGLDQPLDRLDRADLRRLDLFFDYLLTLVKPISIGFRYGSDSFGILDRLGLESIDIDREFIDLAQGRVNVLEFRLVRIKGVFIAHHVQHNLCHARRFAILCTLKDHVLHLGTAKRFGPLFAEHP